MKTKAILTFAVAAALAPAAARADCHFMRCLAMAEAFADSWNAASRTAALAEPSPPVGTRSVGAGERGGPRAELLQEPPRPAAAAGKEGLRAAFAARPLWEHFHAGGKLMEVAGVLHAAASQREITDLFQKGDLRGSVYSFNTRNIKFHPTPSEKLEVAEWKGELIFTAKGKRMKVKNKVYAVFSKAGESDDDWRFDTIVIVPR